MNFQPGLDTLHDAWKKKILQKHYTASVVVGSYTGDTQIIYAQACHGGLNGFYSEIDSLDYIVSGIHSVEPSKKIASWYIHWLTNLSPYSNIFLDKDPESILAKEAFIVDTDVPNNLLLGGLIASRRLWEYNEICELQYEMVQEGVNSHLAYIIAHCIYGNNGMLGISSRDSAHLTINGGRITMGGVKNFINNSPAVVNPSWKDNHTYSCINDCWDTHKKTGFFLDFFKKNFQLEKKTTAVTVNPFKKSMLEQNNIGGQKYPQRDFMKSLAAFQRILFKDIGYEESAYTQRKLAV